MGKVRLGIEGASEKIGLRAEGFARKKEAWRRRCRRHKRTSLRAEDAAEKSDFAPKVASNKKWGLGAEGATEGRYISAEGAVEVHRLGGASAKMKLRLGAEGTAGRNDLAPKRSRTGVSTGPNHP